MHSTGSGWSVCDKGSGDLMRLNAGVRPGSPDSRNEAGAGRDASASADRQVGSIASTVQSETLRDGSNDARGGEEEEKGQEEGDHTTDGVMSTKQRWTG